MIDRERLLDIMRFKSVDRVPPCELTAWGQTIDQGGFLPHLDHAVPPEISYANHQYYRERKMKLLGY